LTQILSLLPLRETAAFSAGSLEAEDESSRSWPNSEAKMVKISCLAEIWRFWSQVLDLGQVLLKDGLAPLLSWTCCWKTRKI